MFSARFERSAHRHSLLRRSPRWGRSGGILTSLVLLAVAVGTAPAAEGLPVRQSTPRPPAAGQPSAAAPEASAPPVRVQRALPAAPPPANLPVIDYGPPPPGFPSDPTPLSTEPLTEGLRPVQRVGVYDAPGGRPRAFLAPTILGVPLTVPVVQRRAGWVAVLLPSANRRLAWVPPGGWTLVPLRDLLVVARRTHRLTWWRNGVPVRSWTVSLGHPRTPTPLGRTFVLGRSTLPGRVYAGTDVFALGAVPDDPTAVASGLWGAHIGLHTWYHDGELGQNTTNGCIRLTRTGQRQLLAQIAPGTALVVVDQLR